MLTFMLTFAHGYYAQHVKDDSYSYLKHVDSAHTLAFIAILLNSDQYSKDLFRNIRGIIDGGDILRDV